MHTHPAATNCAVPTQNPLQREKPSGALRNGNPRGNPNAAPRCGAKTRAGCACRAPAMGNGRCRMHGGASTGPSAAGRARIAAARTTPGRRTAEMRAFAGKIAAIRRQGSILSAVVKAGITVESLGAPIRQCQGIPALRDKQTPEREHLFVLRALPAMTSSAARTRLLLAIIAPATKNPIHRAPRPQPAAPPRPRQPMLCRPARHKVACTRLDPANPFPSRTRPPAT